jgi:transposase
MDMDNGRQQRGIEIAAKAKLVRLPDGTWKVPSQTNQQRKYTVTMTEYGGGLCSCPDHEVNQQHCKHIVAVEIVMQRESNVYGETITAGVRVTYAQNWPAYNAAQVNEKATFTKLLRELCATIPSPPQTMGRPRLPLRDMIFSSAFKVYSTVSARRFMTDLRQAHTDGLIAQLPCYNSIFNCLESEEVTPIIQDMIGRSAAPLRAIETDIAIDSSGFSTRRYIQSWYTTKYEGAEQRWRHDWLKAHIACGVKTNVVTAVQVTARYDNDSPQFKPLLESTAEHFDVKRVLADKAYGSRANLELVEQKGAVPFIPFKSNASGTTDNETWNRLFHFYSFNREQFLTAYHKRSNVETTFSAVKRKFGEFLRSKTPVAQANELLLKFVAHNIVCVIHSMHELGINPAL